MLLHSGHNPMHEFSAEEDPVGARADRDNNDLSETSSSISEHVFPIERPTGFPYYAGTSTISSSAGGSNENFRKEDVGSSKLLFKKSEDCVATFLPAIYISWAVGVLVGVPFLVYSSIPESTLFGNILVIRNFWDALLRISNAPIAILSLMTAVYFAPCILTHCKYPHDETVDYNDPWSLRISQWTGASPQKSRSWARKLRSFLLSPHGMSFVMTLAIAIPLNTTTSLPIIHPGWLWYPFGWFSYRVYHTADLASAMEGLCLDQDVHDIHLPRKSWTPALRLGTSSSDDRQHLPLCLTESQWDFLSAGAISSTSKQDVRSVLKGLGYAQDPKAGLAVAVLGRDVMDKIKPLRENMDALHRFFSNLSVVIFENDSSDGSREVFKQWAAEADLGYRVDLMECAEAKDCKLGKLHRDNPNKKQDFAHSSATGDMDVYRQRMVDYITDLDNTLLGERPENAVACSGRQLLAGSWGTEAIPYDFCAFRAWATLANHRILSLHESFCALMPEGERWRNACNSLSPFLQAEIRRADRAPADQGAFYRVESAFNGAALYPLDLIRISKATYDSGEDGQRCEHVGFHLHLRKPVYTNRKWDMHMDPNNPAGPTGWRAKKIVNYVSGNPFLVMMLIITVFTSYMLFVHSFVLLGVYMVYPIMAPLWAQAKSIQRMLSSPQHKRRSE
ncbi:expressed unknown protein [Seminavis robusta]|uniref:Uncharacterized protein n=1 Tax=Seminavis robusta TaxID=568900 RepID=A0A9N8EAW6_9STRA|nr:expressed unknown protein [Seminavis robusta]|eukprot:Sro877_g214660.1 n/a (676) ;mRNA; r:22296-24401